MVRGNHKTYLGNHRDTGDSIVVKDEERQSGMYVIGVQGVGKSSFLESLIDQDICKGYSVIVLDPHGDLIEHVVAQMPEPEVARTYIFDIEDIGYPFGLNLLSVEKGADTIKQAQAKNRLLHVFERTFPDTSTMLLEKYLGNIAPVFFANPGYALSEVPLFLRDDAFRSQMVKNVSNIFVQDFWEEEYGNLSPSKKQTETASLSTRLNRFVRSEIIGNIIGQSDTTIDFRKAIENKEIILIRLPVKTLPEEASFIGTLLVAQIHAAIFSFSDIQRAEDRPGFSLFVDEFQHFATSDFAEMFTEGRKFGSRVCIAHQFREQIPDFLRAATLTARTIVTFQTTAKDAGSMADVYKSEAQEVRKEDIEPDAIKYLLSYGHAHPVVEHFVKQYLRPLQTMERWKRRLVVKTAFSSWSGSYAHVEDPTGYLNALLYEVQTKGDWTLPIPSEVLWGFSDCGVGYYWVLKSMLHERRVFLATTTDIQRIREVVLASPNILVWIFSGFWRTLLLSVSWLGYLFKVRPEQLADFLITLRTVMQVLASEPLGEKKAQSSSEVAREIGSLPRRHAYIKVGTDISPLHTFDTPRPVSTGELQKRKADIQQRTRKKYTKDARFVMRKILERQKKHRVKAIPDDDVKVNDVQKAKIPQQKRKRSIAGDENV